VVSVSKERWMVSLPRLRSVTFLSTTRGPGQVTTPCEAKR